MKEKPTISEVLNHGCVVPNLAGLIELRSQVSKNAEKELTEKIIDVLREQKLSVCQSKRVISNVLDTIETMCQLSSL
jgi:hypothetical protein